MGRTNRLEELEGRFSQLANQLQDSPEKEAISILHAMLQESRREFAAGAAPAVEGKERAFEQVANLYKSAPAMGGAAENEGLPKGGLAPDFTLLDANGDPVSLSDFRGQPIVLVFYPLDWSPACSDQLSLYESEMSEFQRLGVQVIAISVDSLYSHGAWSVVRGLTFPLLADFYPKGEVARLYQVYRTSDGFSERALFLIDSQGVIRYKAVSPELPHIPDIYELFDQLRSLIGKKASTGN
ncbi:MAG TPA: peroxiredoxin [Anaerolineales bacterium]|nr:peroxiredoxin [Anaerolineales bacterium]